MAQIVKLRRSSVSGQKPTNSNLQLGELALNTTDGKVYMAKSGSLGPSVEELISTNAVNTGSVNISGSLNLIGNETITGSLYLVSSSLPEIRLQNVDYNQNYHLTVGNAGYLNVHDGLGNYVALFGTSSANFINNIYVFQDRAFLLFGQLHTQLDHLQRLLEILQRLKIQCLCHLSPQQLDLH